MSVDPNHFVRTFLKTFSVLAVLGVFAAVGAGFFFFYQITRGLPEVSTLKQYQASHATEVFSDEGKKIGEFTTQRRYPIRFEEIPKHVIYAFLAAEDSHFYEHDGIDLGGIVRAVFSNLLRGRYAQGASTITQQVARGLLLVTRKKELTRKIREMVLARRMEKELTKNEILGLYLSDIYLGHGAYGIGAAAQNYFHKSVGDLNLAEAALLAGLPQRPNEWDPFHNPAMAKKRQRYVLNRMSEQKFVGASEAKEAINESLKLYQLEDINNTAAPYFTEYVRLYLKNKYGQDKIMDSGLKIYTTVRFDAQKWAEKAVSHGIRNVDKRLGWRGVTKNLDTPLKVQTFLSALHEEVVEKVTPVRILTPNQDAKNRKLAYDLSPYQDKNSVYFGETPVTEGEIYKAVVTEVNDIQHQAIAKVGLTSVAISLTTMDWVKVKNQPIKAVSEILKAGDVIEAKVEKIDRKAGTVQASLGQEPEVQGALLSYDVQNGFVRAMIGGNDFIKSQFNIALQAKRQVGSTFKPIIYAAAMDKGFSPSSIVTDSPIVFKFEGSLDADATGEPWRPHNYEDKFLGDIPLRLALIRSMNIPTVKVLDQIGVDYGIQYARNLGITSAMPRDLTIGLGSWSSSLEEVTRAFAVFPRLGRTLALNYIKKVVDESGKVLEETPASGEPLKKVADPHGNGQPADLAISPQTAYVMTDMLKGVVREGTGAAASVIPSSAGKTGTSNNHRDAWFIGYTPYVMTGVWVGYEKDKPLDPAETGGKAAAPIWADYMQGVVNKYPKSDYPIPDDIVFAYIDKVTGRLASSSTTKRVRVAFKVGTVPNLVGDNLPRIGEPGAPRTMTTSSPAVPASGEIPAPQREETNDSLRQGYQD